MLGIAVYLTAVCVALDRRNGRTWEQLTVRYHPGPGLGAAFRNAGVLLEMVDYACRAEGKIDGSLAEALRREAMRVRWAASMGIAPWV
jgi:hypothetical protein